MTKRGFLVVASLSLVGCVADVEGASEDLRQQCAGKGGTPCREGYTCVDDPRDGCDPALGGMDCGGICRRTRRNRCDYNDPNKSYVGRSADECSLIRFVCEPGTEYFADECGCGCRESCSATGLCIEGYVWDNDTCSCVPTPGEACGPVFCASGEVCCNASCGICTPPGYFCTQQACL